MHTMYMYMCVIRSVNYAQSVLTILHNRVSILPLPTWCNANYSSGQKSYCFRLVPCSVDSARVLFRACFVPYYCTVLYRGMLMNKQFLVCIY